MTTLYQLNENIAKELASIEEQIKETKRPTNFILGWYTCLQSLKKDLNEISYEHAKEYSSKRKELEELKARIKELEAK